MLVDALSTRERVETADKKNFKCQGLGWQPRNIAHWPRCWASLGTGTWQVWAAKLQPLCLSVFGKSSSHQQGQRIAFTSKAQDRTSNNGRKRVGRSQQPGLLLPLQRGLVLQQPCCRSHQLTAGTWSPLSHSQTFLLVLCNSGYGHLITRSREGPGSLHTFLTESRSRELHHAQNQNWCTKSRVE